MKSAVASVLVLVAASDSAIDVESNSLLQSKKEQKDRSDLVIPLLDHATKELARVRDNMSDEEMQHAVDKFSSKLRATATSVLQMPQTEQAALLRRASQGKELRGFADTYASLPDDVKMKVRDIALLSPEVNHAYDVLPKHEQEALLVQLEKSTSGKRCETKSQLGQPAGLGNDIRVCQTKTRNGRGGHTHTHWSSDKGSATETVTQNKDGDLVHRHFTKHTHNGRGGDASTETVTQGKNSYQHSHGTSHRIVDGRTVTSTATGSTAHGGKNSHSHVHVHSHRPGDGTSTATASGSNNNGKIHSHDHFHSFDEQTGKTEQGTNVGRRD